MGHSKYASGDRAARDEILCVYDELKDVEYIQMLIDSLPYPVFILNTHRQVVFASKVLLENKEIDIIENVIGNRPGEILGCIHAKEEESGCGTSDACRFCGAVNTIIYCQKNRRIFSDECRIHSLVNDQNIYYDYRVTASPFNHNNKQYVIFSLVDISDEKRRKVMEKIFFHDVNNKIGSFKGLLEILKAKKVIKNNEIFRMLELIGNSIENEILAHKQILLAENNELQLKVSTFSSLQFIQDTTQIILQNGVAMQKKVSIDPNSDNVILHTDEVILQRVIINMLKNALESIDYEGQVKIGCCADDAFVKIWVNNTGEMSNMVQKQVFQRSFSTKGNDRGLGTYSMKLLGENYLKGKLSFTSDAKEGTTFYIILPREKK